MKVIHIESGLGNQMLSYSELLLLKKINMEDDYFIETIIYDIPECNRTINQWYGYELKRIFNIETPDIRTIFTADEWSRIITEIKETNFWETWNYPSVFVDVLNKHGLNLINYRGQINLKKDKSLISKLTDNWIGYYLKRVTRPLYEKRYIRKMSNKKQMFLKTSDDVFTGQWLGLMKMDSGIETIEEDIRDTFKFPEFNDLANLQLKKTLVEENSVAIHARRGDALGTNGYCYRYGYFKRAVEYIKKNVSDPLFVFFTDPGSISWCQKNEEIFGLNFKVDKVIFVDWNIREDSYKDMQLMSYCKHNIITFSSFGWWGTWLNKNPNKITISPSVWINTTHHF